MSCVNYALGLCKVKCLRLVNCDVLNKCLALLGWIRVYFIKLPADLVSRVISMDGILSKGNV